MRSDTSKLIVNSLVGLLVVAIMIIITSYLTFTQLAKTADTFDNVVTRTTPALISIGQIKASIYLLLLEVNEYALNPDGEHAAEFRKAEEDLERALSSYEFAEIGEEETIAEIRMGISNIVAFGESIFVQKDSGVTEEILIESIDTLDEFAEEFISLINQEILRDSTDLILSQNVVTNEVRSTLYRIVLLNLVTLLVTIIAGLVISQSVSRILRGIKNNTEGANTRR